MYCPYCNTEVSDIARFCPKCGKIQEPVTPAVSPVAEPPQVAAPTPVTAQPDEASRYADWKALRKRQLSYDTLLWGIISLVFSISFLSLLGFIFSFVAKSKSREYTMLCGGELEDHARVGHNLATVGFIVGLVMIILSVLYFILFFGIMLAALSAPAYYI